MFVSKHTQKNIFIIYHHMVQNQSLKKCLFDKKKMVICFEIIILNNKSD